MRPLVRNLYASYIAYLLRWSPGLQELFVVMLLNGSGGLTGMIVTKVLRPGMSRILKRCTATQAIVPQQ